MALFLGTQSKLRDFRIVGPIFDHPSGFPESLLLTDSSPKVALIFLVKVTLIFSVAFGFLGCPPPHELMGTLRS